MGGSSDDDGTCGNNQAKHESPQGRDRPTTAPLTTRLSHNLACAEI
jgi:hypothetical protein